MTLYDLLGFPLVYKAAQAVLAPGMKQILTDRLRKAVAGIPASARILDVGCGPASWLAYLGMTPVGLDLNHLYTIKYRGAGGDCVTASASEIPFASDSFDLVLSVSLLHHLPEDVARRAVGEMVRVTRSGGQVTVFDPVMPRAAFARPQAYALHKLDRGRFIRTEPILRSRILAPGAWDTQRITHSYIGTEGLLCTLRKA